MRFNLFARHRCVFMLFARRRCVFVLLASFTPLALVGRSSFEPTGRGADGPRGRDLLSRRGRVAAGRAALSAGGYQGDVFTASLTQSRLSPSRTSKQFDVNIMRVVLGCVCLKIQLLLRRAFEHEPSKHHGSTRGMFETTGCGTLPAIEAQGARRGVGANHGDGDDVFLKATRTKNCSRLVVWSSSGSHS